MMIGLQLTFQKSVIQLLALSSESPFIIEFLLIIKVGTLLALLKGEGSVA